MLRFAVLRQLFVGYLARIWMEVLPQQEYVWRRGQAPPKPLNMAIRPAGFSPGPGMEIPKEMFKWLTRYSRPPVLAYIDQAGWPAMARVDAAVKQQAFEIGSTVETSEGAPACLTYHRLIGNYQANDTFLIRGHFDKAGRLVPEKLVGFGGTRDDRGMGSIKVIRMLLGYRRQLAIQLEKEGRPLPVARPTPKG
jgi:hypothetical protein